MPHNKSQTIKEQERRASMMEEPITVKSDKAKDRPPSLNEIPKNES